MGRNRRGIPLLARYQLLLLLLFLVFDIFLLTTIATGYGVVVVIISQTVSALIGFYQLKKNNLSINTLLFVDTERAKGVKIVRELWEESLMIAGAILLFFPGLFSDVAGYLLMFPVFREKITRFLI